MKKNIVLWGTGETAQSLLKHRKLFLKNREITYFVDNNKNLWGKTFHDFPVISPNELQNLNFDEIVISSILYSKEIISQITDELGISRDKATTPNDIFKEALIEKYDNSNDKEIQDIIAHYRTSGFNIFGKYPERPRKPYYVKRDSDDMPYIMFEGKKMFYPRNRKFAQLDDQEVVYDVLYEQGENSPHLYVKDETEIPGGGVLVDAGVCEGNFALRYIDKVSKCYLIECDPFWIEALKKTFEPYASKVVICDKFLGRNDSEDTIQLDTLVTEKIDFLKMDIEGAEVEALLGAKKTLQRSNARCAICSYHRQKDEEDIKFILSALGYDTETSKGYMFFIYDKNIYYTLDFRRGIVYGKKLKEQ